MFKFFRQSLCQHQQVCHFSSLLLLSDSCFVLTTLSSPTFFLLSQTLWQIWQELSSPFFCSIRLHWIPRHSFLPRNNVVDELAKRGALLAHSATPCSLSPLISRIHSCFSQTGGTLSYLNSLTCRFPRFPLRNLCSLIMLAVSSLVYAATNTAFCYVFISLELAESRILHAAPANTRPRTPLISFCTVQLWTLCATHSLVTLCLSMTCGPDPGELPSFWGSMVFHHAPIPQKGSSNQQQQQLDRHYKIVS